MLPTVTESFLNFLMKSPAADNAVSDSMDVGDTVFKASMRKQIMYFLHLPQTISVFF